MLVIILEYFYLCLLFLLTLCAICYSISPGNVMTPLWEELAGQTPDAAAAIKMGENAQVLFSQEDTKGFLHQRHFGVFHCKPVLV